jgi:hypothetical protein
MILKDYPSSFPPFLGSLIIVWCKYRIIQFWNFNKSIKVVDRMWKLWHIFTTQNIVSVCYVFVCVCGCVWGCDLRIISSLVPSIISLNHQELQIPVNPLSKLTPQNQFRGLPFSAATLIHVHYKQASLWTVHIKNALSSLIVVHVWPYCPLASPKQPQTIVNRERERENILVFVMDFQKRKENGKKQQIHRKKPYERQKRRKDTKS